MDQRVFFPRDVQNADNVPFLQAAARRLVELAARDGAKKLSMERYVCVLPGRRAIRTLEAYLTQCVHEGVEAGRFSPDWAPPTFLRMGEAPEMLYDQTRQIATNLTRLYCERRALEIFLTNPDFTESASVLFPSQPGEDQQEKLRNLVATQHNALRLAKTFLTLDQRLADERKSWRNVAAACREAGLEQEEKRWNAIGRLRALYLDQIEKSGFVDVNASREYALTNKLIGSSAFDAVNGKRREYFIIGAVDLDRQQKDVFDALGDRVQYWVFAPTARDSDACKTEFDAYFESHLDDFFDDHGCVVPDRWDPERTKDGVCFMLPVPEENVFQVDNPQEQGEAVALLTRELSRADARDASLNNGNFYNPIEPEQLTIGTPDPEAVPFIEDAMKELGYHTIHGEGTPTIQNRVYRTLELIAEYLETRSFDTLGELLRRPDVERQLCHDWNKFKFESDQPEDAQSARERELEEAAQAEADEAAAEEAESGGGESSDDSDAQRSAYCELWLREFDEYRAKFLPTRVDRQWFVSIDRDNEQRNRFYVNLRKAARILDETLQDFFEQDGGYLYNSAEAPTRRSGVDAQHDDVERMRVTNDTLDLDKLKLVGSVAFSTRQRKRNLHEWTEPIAKLARTLYGTAIKNRDEQSQIYGFFKSLHQALDHLDKVPEFTDAANGADELVDGAFAIRTLLSEVAGKSVPPTPGSRLVELQGWLDLLFDDAPYCILTSFNEHVVPSTQSSDLFLPNEMRKKLGLSDASRVFARDAYLAYTLARSRDACFVVFEKRTLNNDPRLPSRFLFATADAAVPQRVVKYFGNAGTENFERLRKRHENRPFPLRALKHTLQIRDGRAYGWSERFNDHVCWLDDKKGPQDEYCFSARLSDIESIYENSHENAISERYVSRFIDEFFKVGDSVGGQTIRKFYRGKEFEWDPALNDYCLNVKTPDQDAASSGTPIRLSSAICLYTFHPEKENAVNEILDGKRWISDETEGIRPDEITPDSDEWTHSPFFRFWSALIKSVRRISKRQKAEYGFSAPILTLSGASPAVMSDYASSRAPDARSPFVMNVTDFEKFLQSPYCYFLRKYFRLQPCPSAVNELEASSFGSITHDVLRDFGLESGEKHGGKRLCDVVDENVIFSWLSARLDEHAKKAFNDYTSPFVRVQVEEIRSRLRSFAAWQARWRHSGRVIKEVERSATLELADLGVNATAPFSREAEATIIQGRVDRIDYCESENRWYVFDYKTFDSANPGDPKKELFAVSAKNSEDLQLAAQDRNVVDSRRRQKTKDSEELLLTTRDRNVVDRKHRQNIKDEGLPGVFATCYGLRNLDDFGSNRWINLQLPLYRHFLRKIVEPDASSAVTLGYIVLSKSDVRAFGAPWSDNDLKYADVVCRWVVDSIWCLFAGKIVDPRTSVDGFLPVLDVDKLEYDDYAPITLSYLDEN